MQTTIKANNRYTYKYLFFLIAIYICCFPLTEIGLHKPLWLGYIHLSAGSLVFPFTFIITDVIAETYGFQIARQLIWSNVPATIFYLLTLNFMLNSPSPADWSHQSDYNYIFQGSNMVGILGNAGVVIGFMINIYAVSKWKILVKGKYFWLRSIGASSVGEFVQLLLGGIGALCVGLWPKNEFVRIFLSIYFMRLFLAILLSFPANVLVLILKKIENVDIYDTDIDFNPFKITVN